MRKRNGVIAAAAAAVAVAGAAAAAAGPGTTGISGVPDAQPRQGAPLTVFSPSFTATPVAQGTTPLENPVGIYTRYGYLDDGATQADHQNSKTEPDQNTYVVTRSPGGPTAGYDYGSHFLIQGHEVFADPTSNVSHAYVTRINLDVTDQAHRVTLLTAPDAQGNTGITSLDGSTYDPFTKQVLFASENGAAGGVFAMPLTWSSATPPALTGLEGSIGRGGYEGIRNDRLGNLMILEDVGGTGVKDGGVSTKVKQPNSFLYRFVPEKASDLTKGRLQALQVSLDGTPITFHPAASDPQGARDDALGAAILALHSGTALQAKWVTIHDTAVDGNVAFDANAAAKAHGATPLKRPENGGFVPGSDFASFVFDETGDTDKAAGEYPGAAERGAWGALLRLDMPKAGADTGTVRAIARGDAVHASFDTFTFLDAKTALVGEDRGDTLHQQLNRLDSLWAIDITRPVDAILPAAKRIEAEGRDPEAFADVALKDAGLPDHNDGDNEVTGVHVSNGLTTPAGLLGASDPGRSGFRFFVTNQHGANVTYELTRAKHDR